MKKVLYLLIDTLSEKVNELYLKFDAIVHQTITARKANYIKTITEEKKNNLTKQFSIQATLNNILTKVGVRRIILRSVHLKKKTQILIRFQRESYKIEIAIKRKT